MASPTRPPTRPPPRAFSAVLASEFRKLSGVRNIALDVLALLRPVDIEEARFASVGDTFFVRTRAGHGQPIERGLFTPLFPYFRGLVGERYGLQFSLVGYGADGRGSLHPDRARAARFVISLDPRRGKIRWISFLKGPKGGGGWRYFYCIKEDQGYLATSLIRGCDGGTVAEGLVRHEAASTPFEIALVVDFILKSSSEEAAELAVLAELLQGADRTVASTRTPWDAYASLQETLFRKASWVREQRAATGWGLWRLCHYVSPEERRWAAGVEGAATVQALSWLTPAEAEERARVKAEEAARAEELVRVKAEELVRIKAEEVALWEARRAEEVALREARRAEAAREREAKKWEARWEREAKKWEAKWEREARTAWQAREARGCAAWRKLMVARAWKEAECKWHTYTNRERAWAEAEAKRWAKAFRQLGHTEARQATQATQAEERETLERKTKKPKIPPRV